MTAPKVSQCSGGSKAGSKLACGAPDIQHVTQVFYETKDGGPVGHGAHSQINKFTLSAAQWKMLAAVFNGADGPPVETVDPGVASDGQSVVSFGGDQKPSLALFDTLLLESIDPLIVQSLVWMSLVHSLLGVQVSLSQSQPTNIEWCGIPLAHLKSTLLWTILILCHQALLWRTLLLWEQSAKTENGGRGLR